MKCFLEWKDQYELYYHCGRNFKGVAQFFDLGAQYHALYLLDHQLLDILMDRMEKENFRHMDHETFVQELLDIFGQVSQGDEEFDEEEKDDEARVDLEFDEEEEDEIALEDLSIIFGPLAEHLPNPMPPKVEHLPNPMPPDPLEEHLPDPIPPTAEHLPDPIPPEILLDTIPPDILPDILLDPIPPDILPDAQAGTGTGAGTIAPAPPRGEKRGDGDPAPPRGEKRGDGDPAPPWGEKRGDGDRYAPAPPWGERRGEKRGDGGHCAPVPYVDPGGRQRPEVIGTLCGRGLNDWKRYRANRGRFKDPSRSQIYISDRRRYRSNRGRFRPSSEDRRRSYRSNRDRFKKSINYKTLVMGPVSPMKTETGQRTFVPVCFISFE